MTHFDPNLTTEADFYNLTVPYFRDEELACTVVELPYTSNDSTLFILPDDGRMAAVEAKLLPETLRRRRDSLQPRRIDALHLPRFSISSDYKLEEILPRLGIKKIFSAEADLSGITDTTPLCVSQVVHSAVLDVDEEGTEGAASTGVVIERKSFENFIVRFDSPFLFATVLRDTQSIIFLGKVVNPHPA
uniref:Serpin domain-containing protein n=1 Tax=Sus scrofa TaxID=9823 RepID=A0A8D1U0G0_PIG